MSLFSPDSILGGRGIEPSRSAIIIGCGFIGEATADLLFQEGWAVRGVCATVDSATKFSNKPYAVEVCDASQVVHLRQFASASAPPDLIVFCASSRGGGEKEYRDLYLRGIQNLLEVWPRAQLLFTSSTSVYGQTQGELVDEESPTNPTPTTGKVLLEVEQVVLASGGTAARLAGIYGPGRTALMKKFLTGEAILEAGGHRWTNQIHRDDASRALVHLINAPPGIYNVCDDKPTTQLEIYQWLADFFRRPLPPEGFIDFRRKRGWTSKRVSNQKLRALAWAPQWPSYQSAIPDLALTVRNLVGSW
jgi:nucleoside-diphosphate-sugar epimerase